MVASAIISLLGTAASGVMSYLNNKKSQQQADSEYARQQAYAEAKAAENPLAKSANRAYIGEYDRAAEKQVQTNRARNKILGATPEADIAVQGKVAEGRANLLSGLAQNSAGQEDKWNAIAEQSRRDQANYNQQLAAQRNETYAALAANAANSIGSLVDSGTSSNADTVDGESDGGAKKAPAQNNATTTQEVSENKQATGMAQAEQNIKNNEMTLDRLGIPAYMRYSTNH